MQIGYVAGLPTSPVASEIVPGEARGNGVEPNRTEPSRILTTLATSGVPMLGWSEMMLGNSTLRARTATAAENVFSGFSGNSIATLIASAAVGATSYSTFATWHAATATSTGKDVGSRGPAANNLGNSRPNFVTRYQGDLRLLELIGGQLAASPSVKLGSTLGTDVGMASTAADETPGNLHCVPIMSPSGPISVATNALAFLTWRSLRSRGVTMRIDFYTDDPNGPILVRSVTTTAPDTGTYAFTNTGAALTNVLARVSFAS
jgi:hypothetical protein